jgi:hypothetical protein
MDIDGTIELPPVAITLAGLIANPAANSRQGIFLQKHTEGLVESTPGCMK